jgi:cellulose synthase/poly-beta-1,6-N-acetylglucosamine synthase-like glycosyltransferase
MFMDSPFAIAVCTYNPNPLLIERLLNALQKLLDTGKVAETVLVDNNSSPPIANLPSVQQFLAHNPEVRCIVEPKQGLTAGRCRAIKEISAPIVVFFDDDNEPDADYLEILDKYFSAYPNVGVWGPGQIQVEYIDPVEPWIENYRVSFQQRQSDFGYSCIPAAWSSYFPNGTGFAIRREILEQYVLAIEQGVMQTTDRQGKSLASAGDIQMVWEGNKLGYAGGMIPELRCNHLITGDKANLSYLKRLEFGTASSYIPALIESFPDQAKQLAQPPSMSTIYQQLAKFWIKMAVRPQKRHETQIQFAGLMGGHYGYSIATESPHAERILSLAKRLQLV